MNSFFKGMIMMILSINIISCAKPKVKITPEYIINENWTTEGQRRGGNSIQIVRMKEKTDSIIDPFSPLEQEELLDKLENDSSFIYYTNVVIKAGESYKGKKIYFNQDNGFPWGGGDFLKGEKESRVNVIGTLPKKSWYMFSGLFGYPLDLYVYIDSTNQTHVFEVNQANY